ncbi:uncharacterized protein LOC116254744 [Nymphaea colorata]|nr:uncharacterized protein LOC116254744 [Nymphaea colorata]
MEGGGSNKRVVVVGGGAAGSLIARTLQFGADLVLIDPKDYYEVPWAALRCMVEPAFAQRTLIEHKDYLGNARVVTSTAVKVSEREIVTSEGRCIPYDYLVIATGHPNTFPTTRSERLKEFQESYEKIKASNSVLIVGGGPTGVELAGEIAVDFPEKQITIVHKGSRLLEFVGPKASEKALAWLTSRKVQVLFNQEISLEQLDDTQTEFVTSEGVKVRADCWFNCIGKGVGSSWLTEGILHGCLNERGQLMVDEHFRVKGKENIFAIGDITDIREMKQGYIAHKHALLAAKNLKLLLEGRSESDLHRYKQGSAIAIVSLGRKQAVAQLPFLTTIGYIPGYIKSRDLFVGKTRKELGLDPSGL